MDEQALSGGNMSGAVRVGVAHDHHRVHSAWLAGSARGSADVIEVRNL